MLPQKIGFIGAGAMAQAIIRACVAGQVIDPSNILAHDIIPAQLERIVSQTGIKAATSNLEVINGSDVIFLAVKPQTINSVLGEIAPHVTSRHLVVSIAAGVSLKTLGDTLGEVPCIRVMPNTPLLVGEGMSAISAGKNASDDHIALVEKIFSSAGRVVKVDEHLMDAVTGLSGSGPAYVYLVIEALADGGVKMGLPRATAVQLAAQTLLGSARMVLETGRHPGELKDAVTSPAGTTIAGLHVLEKEGLRGSLISAVEAAAERSALLRQKSGG